VEKDDDRIVVNLEHFSNALIEMAKTFTGKSTEIKEEQPLKKRSPMMVMAGGSKSEVNDLQSRKA